MGLELLEQDIGRDFEDNVWDEKDRQCGIVFHASRDTKIILKAQKSRVTDVDTVRKERKSARLLRMVGNGRCAYRSRKANR